MTRVVHSPQDFTVIGENIHVTRTMRRKGKSVIMQEDGNEAVVFRGKDGVERHLKVPASFKTTHFYQQGQIKHVMIAVQEGLSNDTEEQAEGTAYVHYEVLRQVEAGAQFLDLNVDELSYPIEFGKRAMDWLVQTVQQVSPVPPSIDSSNLQIIATGLVSYDGRSGRPMINSLALERLEAVELVKEYDARVIVTAAGMKGMPKDDEERVANVTKLIDIVLSRGVALSDIYIDAIVFPIAASSQYGLHYLNAVRRLREKYGSEVHITGGISNISFGLPRRKLINDAFIRLGLEAGLDSGIIDPTQSRIEDVFSLDMESEPVRLARDVLTGKDEFCRNYVQAWRKGRLG